MGRHQRTRTAQHAATAGRSVSVAHDDDYIPEPDDWPDDGNVVPIRRAQPTPPHDIAAERHLIATIAAAALPPGAIPPDIWYSPTHAAIHDAAVALDEAGHTVSHETLALHLAHSHQNPPDGRWWAETASLVVTAAKADTLVAQLQTLALARKLANATHDARDEALERPLDANATLAATIATLAELEPADPSGQRVADLADSLDAYLTVLEDRYEGKLDRHPTGLVALDKIIGGVGAGQLIIGAARPGHGKSTFAHNLALLLGYQDVPVLYVSLEMGRAELMDRFVSTVAHVDMKRLRDGRLGPRDWEKVAEATAKLEAMPVTIVDDTAATLGSIRADAARNGIGDGRGLVIVDYLQLMEHRVAQRDANREQIVASLSRGLKLMARQLRCPVLALSQVTRDLKHRADKRPQLTDLRESGALEQDADVVIGLHRQELWEEGEDAGVLEAIVLKQRNGPTGTARLAFLDTYLQIVNLGGEV